MTKLMTAILSAAAMLSLASCGAARPAPTEQPVGEMPAFENAKVEDNIISSARFNLRLTLPEGWELLPDEQLEAILSSAEQFAQEDSRLSTENFAGDLSRRAVMAIHTETSDTVLLVFQEMGQTVDPKDYITNVLIPAGAAYWEDVQGPDDMTVAGNPMARVSYSYTVPGETLTIQQAIYLQAVDDQLLTITASSGGEGPPEAACALVEGAAPYGE